MGRKKLGTPRICAVCQREFYKPPSHTAKWPAVTCSRACCAVLRLKGEERACRTCGKPFYPRPNSVRLGFGLYCSNDCNGAAFRKPVAVDCRWCGRPFTVTPHLRATRKKHFCDRSCSDAWMKRFGSKKGRNAFSTEQKRAWLAGACARCGTSETLELDHITPRFAGGKATRENAQTLCRRCNREKFWKEDLLRFDAAAA